MGVRNRREVREGDDRWERLKRLGTRLGKKKLKGPGDKANLSGRSQFTFAPEESAEHDDCRQQE